MRAVVSTAGYAVSRYEVDEGMDWIIVGEGVQGVNPNPKVDVQLKCTQNIRDFGDKFAYDLNVSNYRRLRTESSIPSILVVVFVPDNVGDWLDQSEDRLLMRKCGYWLCLQGYAETDNDETIAVHIPKSNMFTPSTVQDMLLAVATNGRIG